MGFLSPWFLLGALAAALPVYLHLLRQHKTTPVPFPSLMFFEKRTQSSVKHRRLKYFLLLALRIAMILLLALAFAQPFVRRATGAGGGTARWLVAIDESFSMRAGTRLADARRQALELLAARKPGTPVQVAALGEKLRLLTESIDDAGQLRAAVETVKGSDQAASYGELARAVRSMAQPGQEPLELHLFSDMQKSGLPASFADLSLPAHVRLALHPVTDKAEANWAVETVSAPAIVWDPKKARVQATIAGYATEAASRTASLVVNGKTTASKSVAVGANARATVEFLGLDVPYGTARCEVRIDGGDALEADDRAVFAVERSDPRKVLVVHEARDTRSPFFLRSALAAAAEAAFSLDAVPSEQAGNLDPARFAFVVLSDVLSLPPRFEEALKKYVRAGGSVLIAAGPSIARHGTIPVLDAKVDEGRYYSRAGERFAIVGESDPMHPAMRRAGRWEGAKFYYALRIEPGEARVAARLNDQTPLLVDRKIGEGRVLFYASTFDNVANDFPQQPAFVAFIDQTARYLAGVEDRTASVAVGSHVELRSAREGKVPVEVIEPGGNRPLSLSESTTAQTFLLAREGFYEVRRANGRHEVIAANADRRESNLTPIPKETLDLWSGTPTESAAGNPAAGLPEEQDRKPWSLWWYFVLALAAAAVAESFLASRYLGVQRDEEE